MGVARFILARLAGLVAVLWVLVTIVFVLGTIIPSDPARVYAGEGASPEVIAQKRAELGLDKPVLERYADYLSGLLQGDLSTSVHTRSPVRQDITDALPATLELLAAALVLTAGLGLGVGMLTARATRSGRVVRPLLLIGASIPSFCLALLLLLLLYSALGGIFPPGGQLSPELQAPDGPTGAVVLDGLLNLRLDVVADGLWHLVLPAICLALGPALLIARTLRSSLRHSLRQDYARTARAKGLPERRVLWGHALRNSLNAPLTIAGLEIGAILAGVAVVETIFSWPGIGAYTDRSIATNDFPAIAGVTLVIGFFFVMGNLLVDLGQVVADPRLRRSRA